MRLLLVKRILLLLSLSLLLSQHTAMLAIAQDQSAGVGVSVPVAEEVETGDILCHSGASFGLCRKAFSSDIVGVVADNAGIALEAADPQGQRLIVSSGVILVKVSTLGGPISEGDFITSSDNPGVGQKAPGNGYVLGSAMENYDSGDVNEIGQIPVALNIHLKAGFSGERSDLFYMLRQGLSSSVFEPVDSLRYLLAVIIVIVSFTFGIMYFGRVAKAGVEAMGRNPLARSSIQVGIVLSILLSFVMIMVGLGLAYFILVL